MATTLRRDVRSLTDTLTELLVGLGVDAEQSDSRMDLAIDRFDQWTNPKGTAMACTCCYFGTDVALERAA